MERLEKRNREPVYEVRVFINRRLTMTGQLNGLDPLTLVSEAFIRPGWRQSGGVFSEGPGPPTEFWIKGGQWEDWTLRYAHNVDEDDEPTGPRLKESLRPDR